MCRFRRVQNSYKCGHVYNLPDEHIQCDDRYCRFSSTHPADCVPPTCTHSCWQYHQFPEQYNPKIFANCPDCVQQGRH